MVSGGLRPIRNSVTVRKVSFFCNNLLALYAKGQDLLFSVPLRVDAVFVLA